MSPEQKLAGRKVLVVDDNFINLDVAVEALQSAGAKVDGVTTGAEAIKLVESNAYDLLLLDLFMPEIDGLDVGRAARSSALNKDSRVLIFTASDKEDARNAQRKIGANGIIAKPVEIDDLLDKAASLF